jgi:polyribonucleotide nucleotidyltransferase
VLQEVQEISVFFAGVDKQGRVKLEWKDKPGAVTAPEAPLEAELASSLTAEE